MDPITALTIATTISTLVVKTGSVIKTLSDLQQKYKDAALSIQSTIMACQTLNAALTGMQKWISRPNSVQSDPLKLQMAASASHVKLVMIALEREIGDSAPTGGKFGWLKKTKVVWKSETFRGYEICIQQQCVALNLLLNVFQLQTSEEQVKALTIAHDVFDDAMDSASTIIPEKENPFEDELHSSPVYRRTFSSNLTSPSDAHVTPLLASRTPVSNEGYEDLPVHLTTFARIMSEGFHLTTFASKRVFNTPTEARKARAKVLQAEGEEKAGKLDSKLVSEIMEFSGSTRGIIKLLDKGAKLQIPLFISNGNGLMAPKSTLVQLLLIFGETDVHQPTAHLRPGWSLLHEAALRDCPDIVAKLLSRGAAPFGEDEEHNTPFSIAIREGYLPIADQLLAAAKERDTQAAGNSAQSVDSNNGWNLKNFNLRTVDLERKPRRGLTCFLTAIKEKRYDLAELLLAAGSSPDAKDIKGRSALFYLPDIPSTRSVQMGELLIKHGANIHTRDKEGRTAFLKAVTRGDCELAKFFISAGSDINVQHRNLPAVYYASILTSSTILRLLLERRADIEALRASSDNSGRATFALQNLIGYIVKKLPGSRPSAKGDFPEVENLRILWEATAGNGGGYIYSQAVYDTQSAHIQDGTGKLLNILLRISIIKNGAFKLDDLAWADLKPIIEREKNRVFFHKLWPNAKWKEFWEHGNWTTTELKRKRISQIATWDDDT